jgi:hypothetical protein
MSEVSTRVALHGIIATAPSTIRAFEMTPEEMCRDAATSKSGQSNESRGLILV